MKIILNLIFSPKTTVLLLFILAAAMGSATFVEEKYDTETAKLLIYNAKWFEFLFLLLALNFMGSIKKYNLMSRKKLAGFAFHLAFIVIILGAAITRYTGYSGTMMIRQDETSNVMYSSDVYLRILPGVQNDNSVDIPVHLSKVSDNKFHKTVETKEFGTIDLQCVGVIRNAIDTLQENVPGGKKMLQIVVATDHGRVSVFLDDGEVKDLGKCTMTFNAPRENALNISDKDGELTITTPVNIKRTAMPAMIIDTIVANAPTLFKEKCLYEINGGMFVFKAFHKNAKKILVSGKSEEKGPDALQLELTINGKKYEESVLGGNGYISNYQDFNINGKNLRMTYGEKEIQLPFSLYLNRFILERYPGSNSPSSFKSEVTLLDKRNNKNEKHSIFMNNVLDYDGYRFFQTSYDQDEKGTILTVNHDSWGTYITYLGYILLALGFLLTLFNKNSRFHLLGQSIQKIGRMKKTATIIILIVLFSSSLAVAQTQSHVSAVEADKFGHLVTQTMGGRFEPVHSLAYDVLHKLAKKDVFDVAGYGQMNAMQVFVDMILNVEFWKTQKLVYVKEKSVQDILGIEGKYASFNDFFDKNGNYKIKEFAENSFRKKQAEQNTFDKEIIKVDERANICMMVFNGTMLKIFPSGTDANATWFGWDDSLSRVQLGGSLKVINDDLQLREFNYSNMLGLYFQQLYEATRSSDYSAASKTLQYLHSIQHQGDLANVIISDSKINFEIQYNKQQGFVKLTYFYSCLSLILLLLSFFDELSVKKKKFITWSLNGFIGLLGIAFLYHTYCLIVRWYLSGHAPWSTGYEALLFISWGGLLAGFIFARHSKIALAATTLLAFFILMTAGHSSYDPQITNLQPVLKSYWLIIHVAMLTISYGFLGLGFVLGLINMFIYLFKNDKNRERLDLVTLELTNINEMNLTIGLFLATVGTFLGGVWANESWGKYWGWDAKETWALVIVITYTIVLHLRFVSKLRGEFIFNIGSVLGYSSVLMTFIGVNYYLTKGLHSYAQGDTPVFPIWAWLLIVSLFALIFGAGFKQRSNKRN